MALLKAFHLIFMVTWFAALFYLPRLYVYHAMATDSLSKERFCVMERKLFWGIMTPGGVLTIICGMWMLYAYAWQAFGHMLWLRVKLGFVASLIAYHVVCWWHLRAFAADRNTRSHVYYRIFNEVPVIALVAIILLAVLRPT